MYIPAHFAMTPEQIAEVLASGRAGDLVTHGPEGLVATYVPMLHEPDGTGFGRLVGHLSLVNDQWRPGEAGEPVEALFVLHGPDDYVEAGWLSTPASPNVPTWNYVTVHAWGELVVHRDPEWILSVVRRLSRAHGDASVDAMDSAAVDKLLRAIVGVEVRITRVDGKAKMSQNKSPQVVGQVIHGLREAGSRATADWMEEHSLPRARAKADLLDGIRTRRP
ncbi:FMN-binding negative transcriptional regulator [Propionicimonas sp.]|uniref:FMN-binding negative transcriptional regulator n=1 Tax=Propionicimonas sp. TaxID=1955623 RepID=UPI0039E51639